jgi:hypothetical protein
LVLSGELLHFRIVKNNEKIDITKIKKNKKERLI